MNIYRTVGEQGYQLVKEPSRELHDLAQAVFFEHLAKKLPAEERSRPIFFTCLPGYLPEGDGVYTIFEPRPAGGLPW